MTYRSSVLLVSRRAMDRIVGEPDNPILKAILVGGKIMAVSASVLFGTVALLLALVLLAAIAAKSVAA